MRKETLCDHGKIDVSNMILRAIESLSENALVSGGACDQMPTKIRKHVLGLGFRVDPNYNNELEMICEEVQRSRTCSDSRHHFANLVGVCYWGG